MTLNKIIKTIAKQHHTTPERIRKEMEKAIYQILDDWKERERSRGQSRSCWDRDERWFNQKL